VCTRTFEAGVGTRMFELVVDTGTSEVEADSMMSSSGRLINVKCKLLIVA
jgi:hypothetical protein